MDAIDHAILSHLRRDSSLTNTELADLVGLTPSPCLRRVKKLEADGIITGYRAVVSQEALDRGFQVIVTAEIGVNDQATIEQFESRVAAFDEVIECRRLFGIPDYFIRVAVRDLATYERFMVTKLGGLPAVSRVTSLITMKTIKSVD
ncbi:MULTISPECIES: Lrp/AsnC family transcriptional regulator [Rhodococcus]|jgi:DNA-binding Lrp family transcriptional regulator|uniref:Lrp/AsnC family transcriptional regulator n=1 Tax=Rhodococcus oxybenzonivorans TaxID=1990687 RepID=A0AAE4V132_9NOCA|nr:MULTISPECIES: Lrp/AsnC family transcriptional regulator [Rhodococcus]MDV7246169.1 Lrp/AsnC family transcriptional regulator [Rhodococcus oxybenzonivorans]MDV7266865.1 Lrp/AsnC family transcriptional regulator [Rhodococcus oxybenzonivorans]MDV7277884.1 Lrp/AsnC family transcriptional regulator [Rhodococcus oxybenzonivorans]MDV7337182.1 Lrp/AsnC family transcriptional regulator [Rhodococcus oxybenzonivorans]MDV7347465.1 Lrp/AsnC family transcriptional regulator [Rhodococcus oxybenzonivorans]